MPASAGRVRMPHNNRLSTSGALKTSDIWSKTIGHDPYAADSEKQDDVEDNQADAAKKARGLLELARHQNVAGDTKSRDDFARKMYLGLKRGKKKSRNDDEATKYQNIKLQEILEQQSSSSEEEYVEVAAQKEAAPAKAAKKKKKMSSDDSPDDDSDVSSTSSSSSSKEQRRRRRRREKKRKKKRKRRRKYESDSEEESVDEERRKRRKRKSSSSSRSEKKKKRSKRP